MMVLKMNTMMMMIKMPLILSIIMMLKTVTISILFLRPVRQMTQDDESLSSPRLSTPTTLVQSSWHQPVCSVHCEVCCAQYLVFSVKCALHSVQ